MFNNAFDLGLHILLKMGLNVQFPAFHGSEYNKEIFIFYIFYNWFVRKQRDL